MPTIVQMRETYEFDCPSCSARLTMGAARRGEFVECYECHKRFPGPVFRQFAHENIRRLARVTYSVSCEHCSHEFLTSVRNVGHVIVCPECRREFEQKTPVWWEWFLPVSRTFSDAEKKQSIMHQMFRNDRQYLDDSVLPAKGRRRFRFYCGECGTIHVGRVWDIAVERDCSQCNTTMVVPAPMRPGVGLAVQYARLLGTENGDVSTKTFCPSCGRQLDDGKPADRPDVQCATCQKRQLML